MPLATRVLTISPAHPSTICKNAAKSCICHRSAKPARKPFICHTSKNALPQVLCLPHLRVPPGGAVSATLSSQFGARSRRYQNSLSTRLSAYVHSSHLPKARRANSLLSPATSHKPQVTCFKSFSTAEGFYFPVVSHDENRLCYTDLGLGKLAS